MARNDNWLLVRLRDRRTETAAMASEPEWLDNLRDIGLMLSGIYQDLRGDTRESYGHFRRWVKGGLRKFMGSRDV